MKQKVLSKKISNYTYDNVEYKAYSHEKIKEMFLQWANELSFREKLALKIYRTNNFLRCNINAKLRRGKTPRNANIISTALGRAVLSENIIVYRRLAKCENENMQLHEENDIYLCKDFKGTHVETLIEETGKRGVSAGYMFVLIPQNSIAAYINDVTPYRKKERELLIDRNQSFLLIKKFTFWERNGYLVKLINT